MTFLPILAVLMRGHRTVRERSEYSMTVLSHGSARVAISNSVKSKRECLRLCEDPHRLVVGAVYVHVLRTLKYTVKKKIPCDFTTLRVGNNISYFQSSDNTDSLELNLKLIIN